MQQDLPGITEVCDEVQIALDRVRQNLAALRQQSGDGDPYRAEEQVRLMVHDLAHGLQRLSMLTWGTLVEDTKIPL